MKLRMVDRILGWEPGACIRGAKVVSFEEYTLKEPFGGDPRLPELLLLQAAFELGAWYVILGSDYRECGLGAGFGEVAFPSQVAPGERVLLELRAQGTAGPSVQMMARGRVGDRDVLVASALTLQVVSLESLGNPEDFRTLAGEIFLENPRMGP